MTADLPDRVFPPDKGHRITAGGIPPTDGLREIHILIKFFPQDVPISVGTSCEVLEGFLRRIIHIKLINEFVISDII